MPIKRTALYSTLWESADQLRGGMDASQYKDYVLVLLFMKYVSDKYSGNPNAVLQVPEGGSFADMVKLKNKKNIGDKINQIIRRFADENDLVGVITVADFNDEDKLGKGQEMVERLTNLIGIFENPALDFSKNRAEGDDLLGDAYEYFMRHFARESGKSKGQFYSPTEVSRVMSQVIDIHSATRASQTLYDPTCGSASLLLRAADEAPVEVSIFGQEKDNATRALAKMNMILHGHPSADIVQGNTLSNPLFREGAMPKKADVVITGLRRFNYVVANFPFSDKAWSNGVKIDQDPRFEGFGVPPLKNGDYAYFLHVIASLKSSGKGAVILPHGVLFRGNAEGQIRKNIVERGFIKGIIGLPANLFYGTGIPACIIVLDKENAEGRKGIFMVDASKGFVKDGNKNRLRFQDIHKIVDVFNHQIEIEKYSRMVPLAEIRDPKNNFNLNLPRYIDTSEPEDIQDIRAHLQGGLPPMDVDAMRDYWQIWKGLQDQLFAKEHGTDYRTFRVDAAQSRELIRRNPDFAGFVRTVHEAFNAWGEQHTPTLERLCIGDHPKQLIKELSEDILRKFSDLKILSAYDVYQYLMTHWAETMQDDVYMIVTDGWQANRDLIPPPLLVTRYFGVEQQVITDLQAEKENLAQQKQELEEEHAGEDGLLQDAKTDKGKLTRTSINKRFREIAEEDADDERAVLNAYLDLLDREGNVNTRLRQAQSALDEKVEAKYKTLKQTEIKQLVINDKWMTTLQNNLNAEVQRIEQALDSRIQELSARYTKPLSQIEREVNDLNDKVAAHLRAMGYAWN